MLEHTHTLHPAGQAARPTRRTTLGLGAVALGGGTHSLGAAPPVAGAGTGEVASAAPAVPPELSKPSGLTTIPAVREFRPGSGEFTWTGGLVVTDGDEELATVAETFADDLEHLTGSRPEPTTASSAPAGSILLTLGDQGQGEESYALDIAETLTVTGTTAHGAFNGTRTVLQLLAQSGTIPAGTVADWPDKEIRSVLLDNTLQHFSLDVWRTLVRHMSYVKLNDTNLYVDGAGLSIEEMRQIDDLAARYYVTVVPQLNMPAHMNQILPAHPEYQLDNPDGTKYTIALDLTSPEAVAWALGRLEEYLDVFRSAEWHLGSDEFPGWPGTGENHPQLDAYSKERFGPEATFADLFADFQNQANALVKSYGKTMRVWNDMIRESSVVQLDTDVTVEYWIEHDELPGLLSPGAVAERGNPLINAHVDFLYYDQSQRNLDPQLTYEQFHTGLFPYRNEVPEDAVRGARVAVWLAFIGTPIESDAEVIANIVPSLNAHGQITWGTEKIAADYAAFRGVQEAVGRAPGSAWLGTGDIAPHPQLVRTADGSVAVLARTAEGSLLTGKQSRPGRTHWSAQEIATDTDGDVQVTTLPDGRWRAAARAVRGLVIATQTAPEADGADEIETALHRMPLDEDPALAGEAVIVSSRRSLLLVDADSGDTTRLGAPARGAVSADHHDSFVAAVADSPQGVLVVRGSEGSWTALHADRSLSEPQVVVADESAWVIGVDENAALLAGVVDEEAVTWEEIDIGAIGRPAVATAPDGTVHIASVHEDGEIRLHRLLDGAWTTESPLTDMLGDPAIGFSEDGDVRVLGHAVRETLRMAQRGQEGWEVAELAESTLGLASLTWDTEGWPIYAIATAYGDLQTGTHWGEGVGDWGRDFIIGTMSTPGDHLHPDEFVTSLFADDFTADTGEYASLPADPGLPAPEPEIGQGRLAIAADGPFSTLVRAQAPLPEGDAVLTAAVEALPLPGQGAGTVGAGIARDEENYALMWASSAGRIGFEIRTDGTLTDTGADIPRVVEAGDRIALTISGAWLTGWVRRHGIWDRVHTQQLNVAEEMTDPEVRTSYRWALVLRGDGPEVAFSSLEAFGR